MAKAVTETLFIPKWRNPSQYLARRAEELEDDSLTILDLENIVLTGQVIKRQRDAKTRQVKCVVSGFALDGSAAEAVVKLGFTGKLVVITVYLG